MSSMRWKYVDDGDRLASRSPFARMLCALEEDMKVQQNWWKIVIRSHDQGKKQNTRLEKMLIGEDGEKMI